MRIAAVSGAVLLPVLLVAGVVGVSIQRNDLTAGIAGLAEDRARQIADAREVEAPSVESIQEDLVQVVSSVDRRVLDATEGAPRSPLTPPPARADEAVRDITRSLDGEPDRFVLVSVRPRGRDFYVIVGRSLESVDAAAHSTARLFLVGAAMVLLLVVALTWIATGRALAPIEAMRRRADSMSGDELGPRLPVPASDDEVARLAVTFNHLLERIEHSTRAQRRFVADASHELRSPVATIRTLHESDQLSGHPGGRAGLSGDVLVEVARLTRLVNGLLLLARGDSAPPSPHARVDLSALLRREGARARSIAVTVVVEDGLVVLGHKHELAAAIRNLLDNAERHGRRSITLAGGHEGTTVLISVTDDGPGVPMPDRERIFERFVRLDDSRTGAGGGAGLGLAIVRQIVGGHGGTVRVVDAGSDLSFPGARVEIVLPGAGNA